MNQFPPEFRDQLNDLMRWRRDVRHFHADKPVPDELLAQVLDAIRLAPSVGLSEPWRIVVLNRTWRAPKRWGILNARMQKN